MVKVFSKLKKFIISQIKFALGKRMPVNHINHKEKKKYLNKLKRQWMQVIYKEIKFSG